MDAILREIDFKKGGGLVTAIAQDEASGEILMVAHMNEPAVRKTLETREVHYWSRSRNALWHKGEESGHVQKLKGFYIDCDGDAVLVKVDQVGDAACHTGRRSCFFRRAQGEGYTDVGVMIFDPKGVYKK